MSTQQAVRDLPLLCSQTGSQRKIKISKNQNPGPWNLELAGSTLPPCKGLEEEIARKPHSFYDSVQKNSGFVSEILGADSTHPRFLHNLPRGHGGLGALTGRLLGATMLPCPKAGGGISAWAFKTLSPFTGHPGRGPR